jgi:hypothetical protein
MERPTLFGERSQSIGELTKAHAKAIGEMRNAPRNHQGHFGKYADLGDIIDAIRKPFSSNGLRFSQEFQPFGDQWVLVTELSHVSGEWQRSALPINHRLKPQDFAASATYMKRIALSAIAGIAAEDEDDGTVAQTSAMVSEVDDRIRYEKIIREKWDAADTEEKKEQVIARAIKGVEKGMISNQFVESLQAAPQA